jgi:hypothetical protein
MRPLQRSKWAFAIAALGAIAVLGSQCNGSTEGSSDGGACNPACDMGVTCCAGQCVNLANDPHNCGACGFACTGAASYCAGSCSAPPCDQDAAACGTELCCGTQCCGPGQLCCQDGRQGRSVIVCYTLQAGETTCPVGCPACISDRTLKRDVEPVDPQSVLERASRMPITTWSYASDDPSVRHMGMMAQDFYGQFRLGRTDTSFNPVDAHGVEMAAIQALYERVRSQDARIDRLERENAEPGACGR